MRYNTGIHCTHPGGNMPRALLTALCSSALVIAGTIAAQQSDDPMTLAQQAGQALEAKRYSEAAGLYERVAAMLPRNISVRIALARALAAGGNHDGAIEELRTVADSGLRFDPDDPAFAGLKATPRFDRLVALMRSRTAPILRSETAFLLEKDLIPENIAWDSRTGNFYIGSMYKAKIDRISADGMTTPFVLPRRDGLWGVLGMKIDPARRELWANSCNIDRPPLMEPHPATAGQAAIFRFDLDSGKLIAKYPGPHGSKDRPFCFNDLVLAPNGDVYATSGPDGIFRVARGESEAKIFVSPDSGFFNGIAIEPDGRFLYGASHLEGIVRYDTASKSRTVLSVPPGVTLGAIDGLYFHEESLVGVQGSDPRRVVRAWLDRERRRVTRFAVLEQDHPLYDYPLTGVVVGNDLYYVAGSGLRSFEDGKILPMDRLKETVILRLPLELPPNPGVADEEARRSLLAMHEQEVRAHFERNAAWLGETTDDSFVSATGGKIFHSTGKETASFFERYFEDATYLEYENLEEPIVRLSDDGSMGWIISRTKVRRVTRPVSGSESERSFVYAGVMIYQRQNGEWKRVANASTFE